MSFRRTSKLLGLLVCCIPGIAAALGSDREQPIFIEAESVEIDKSTGISRYLGNVKFSQGSLIIRGGSVVLYHRLGEIEKVIIQGKPASFQQTPDVGDASIVSRANKIEYIAQTSRLFLFESALVSQGNNQFTGDKIEYDIVHGTVVANGEAPGKGRIKAIIEQN